MGRRMARMQREAATLNAATGTRVTERFSAPGAALPVAGGRYAELHRTQFDAAGLTVDRPQRG